MIFASGYVRETLLLLLLLLLLSWLQGAVCR